MLPADMSSGFLIQIPDPVKTGLSNRFEWQEYSWQLIQLRKHPVRIALSRLHHPVLHEGNNSHDNRDNHKNDYSDRL